MLLGDHAEIGVFATQLNQVAVVKTYLRCTGQTGTGASNNEVAAAESSKISASLKALMDGTAKFIGLTFNHIFPGFREQTITVTSDAGFGTVVGTPLPGQVAGVISKRTTQAGRRFRGRTYVPFPSDAFLSLTGLPSVGYTALLGSLALDMFGEDTVVGAGGTSTFVSLLRASNPATSPNNWEVIIATFSNAKWGTQRRRGSYGRANVLPF